MDFREHILAKPEIKNEFNCWFSKYDAFKHLNNLGLYAQIYIIFYFDDDFIKLSSLRERSYFLNCNKIFCCLYRNNNITCLHILQYVRDCFYRAMKDNECYRRQAMRKIALRLPDEIEKEIKMYSITRQLTYEIRIE